jgi:hypothetical protein
MKKYLLILGLAIKLITLLPTASEAQYFYYYPPFLTLQGYTTAPALSPSTVAYLYYNKTNSKLYVSMAGAAYAELAVAGAAYGSDTNVLYNCSGSICGNGGFTYDGTKSVEIGSRFTDAQAFLTLWGGTTTTNYSTFAMYDSQPTGRITMTSGSHDNSAAPTFTMNDIAGVQSVQISGSTSQANSYMLASRFNSGTNTADNTTGLGCDNGSACISAEASPAATDMTITPDAAEYWVFAGNAGIQSPSGTAALPAIKASDADSGIYFTGSDTNIDFTVNNSQVLLINTAGPNIPAGKMLVLLNSISGGAYITSQNDGSWRMQNVGGTASSSYTAGIKALPNNTITTFATVTMLGAGSNAGGTITYSIEDTTTRGTKTGIIRFAAADTTNTITCTIQATDATEQSIGGAAGFAVTGFACADGGSNVLNLRATALTTGGTDTLQIRYTIIGNFSFTVNPQ